MPNLYATLAEIKNELGETSTNATRDAILLSLLEDMSRKADQFCIRHFYVRSATKYIDVVDPYNVLIDDCLSLSGLTGDSEGDGSFDGTTYTQGDLYDFVLWPDDEWPKLAIRPAVSPDYTFSRRKRYLKAVGLWGYGDGESATPYKSSGYSGTLSNGTDTSLVITGADATAVILPGHTLLIESEQVYVSAAAYSSPDTTITVVRGVNGTTAAAHSAAAISIYKYPREVSRWVLDAAKDAYLMRDRADLQMEMIGQYQYQRRGMNMTQMQTDSMLGKYQRLVAA